MRVRRKVPDWISNLAIVAVFTFAYLVIYCKALTLGYRVSELEKKCEQLKTWNQYYRSLILKDLSYEKVRTRVEKMNLSLEIPENWRIIYLAENEKDVSTEKNTAHASPND